ncbi:hypothetical protein [Mesorhizobium cantuariense]|uniref:Uncharacterized protein n=1 Tax=Mesorhizobium cantuariense TaxID=1300275 RepID=A0ABV7MQB1_9HYPH
MPQRPDNGPAQDQVLRRKQIDIIGVQRERRKPAMFVMADRSLRRRRFVTFKADKRQAPGDRVQGKVDGPVPKGQKKDNAEWLKRGLVGR